MAWSLTQVMRLGMVPLSGNVTIAGEKTFSSITRIQNTLSGPRRNVITRGATVEPAAADSMAYVITDGGITIPTTTGAHYRVRLGGDHDITFNGTTCDVSAEGWGTGDILDIQVESATVCKVWRAVAAADLGAFA